MHKVFTRRIAHIVAGHNISMHVNLALRAIESANIHLSDKVLAVRALL